MSVKRTPGVISATELQARLKAIGNGSLRVGFFESSTYEDGTPVAYVAAIQEFGSPAQNTPSRSFMRTTMSEQRHEWVRTTEGLARMVLHNKLGADQALEQLGSLAAGDIRQKIADIDSPALSPRTIDQRNRQYAKRGGNKSTKPLVDRGILISSVTHRVDP